MIHVDNLGQDFFRLYYSFLVSFILNCQMRNLGGNQNLLQILLIKVNRYMFFFPYTFKTVQACPLTSKL